MVLTKDRYEEIKSCFGMWMYESFQSVLHVTHYNFEKINIKKFSQEDKVAMAIAIFNKRVDLEVQGRQEGLQTSSSTTTGGASTRGSKS